MSSRLFFFSLLLFFCIACKKGDLEDQLLIDQGFAKKIEEYYEKKSKECLETLMDEAALLADLKARDEFITNLNVYDSLPEFPDKPIVILKDSVRAHFRNEKIVKKLMDSLSESIDTSTSK